MTSSFLQPEHKRVLADVFSPVISKELFKLSIRYVLSVGLCALVVSASIGLLFSNVISFALSALAIGCIVLAILGPTIDTFLEKQVEQRVKDVEEIFRELDDDQRGNAIAFLKQADPSTIAKTLRIVSWTEMLLLLKVSEEE